MSYDPDYYEPDYYEDDEEAYEEFREQTIQEFASDRLQLFYREHSTVLQPARESLDEARNLLPSHPAACVVFAAVARPQGQAHVQGEADYRTQHVLT